MENKNKLISLNELAKKCNLNKSYLAYYKTLGLISPQTVVGKMQIFDQEKTLNILKKINKLKEKGISLILIKDKL